MKSLLILSVSLLSSLVQAGQLKKISCEVAPYKVEVNYAEIGTAPNNQRVPFWTLFKNDAPLEPFFNTFTDVQIGYDGSFLNSYVFGFMSNDAVIGAAVPGLKTLKPGTYSNAKADLFISLGQDVMDGSTIDCVVIID